MKNFILVILLVLAANLFSYGQNDFKVGDEVELNCNCFGRKEWVLARVESVSGDIIKVRYGNGKNQFQNVVRSSGVIRGKGQGVQTANDVQLRNQFINEAAKYRATIVSFAPFYDSNFQQISLPAPKDLQNSINQLAELDALCKAKYTNLKNDPNSPWKTDVNYQPGTWCEIASKRSELEKPMRMKAANTYLRPLLTTTLSNLDYALKHEKNRTPDETQELLFERAKWKADQSAKFKLKFAEYGVEMPVDFLGEVEKKADQLMSLINQNAPNRSWEKPPYSDASVESFVKTKYAAEPEYKGAKITKIGLDYTTWKQRESLSYIGSDSNFRYYKVEYNEYKRGWALVKMPNQPFCQAREWIVGRKNGGLVIVSLGGSGIFMKCL